MFKSVVIRGLWRPLCAHGEQQLLGPGYCLLYASTGSLCKQRLNKRINHKKASKRRSTHWLLVLDAAMIQSPVHLNAVVCNNNIVILLALSTITSSNVQRDYDVKRGVQPAPTLSVAMGDLTYLTGDKVFSVIHQQKGCRDI